MFNLQMDFNIKAFKYYGNITVPLQKCSSAHVQLLLVIILVLKQFQLLLLSWAVKSQN